MELGGPCGTRGARIPTGNRAAARAAAVLSYLGSWSAHEAAVVAGGGSGGAVLFLDSIIGR